MGIEDLPDPPPPPSIGRRVRLYAYQYVGLALLVAIPVLALAGVFGESDTFAEERAGDLQVSIRYPARYRLQQVSTIEIGVVNSGPQLLDSVSVALDSAYANRFSNVQAVPNFREPYTIELSRMGPGEQRLVVIELKAAGFGRHRGELRVAGIDTARFRLATTIFP